MGMYDEIRMWDDAPQISCGQGHPQWDLQTKDMDCDLTTYHIWHGRLYEETRKDHHQLVPVEGESPGTLRLTWEGQAAFAAYTGTMAVYTHCDQCDPVVFEDDVRGWDGGVYTRKPWVEYELKFVDGILVEATPITQETREQVAQKECRQPLPDTDRVAKRTIEQHREGVRKERGYR